MWFGILGRLEVSSDDGEPVEIGGAQPRTLVALLLLAGGRVVATDAIIDAIWGDGPPSSPVGTLQTYVSRLRRVLGPPALVWEAPGYRLAVDRDAVDAWRFERLAADGRAALDRGDLTAARELLMEADALWRGPALHDFRDLEFAFGVAARLEERRLVALEDRLSADLQLGRHEAAVAELTELVAAHPFREGLRAQLALALYRSGRQTEALRSIKEARRKLSEELGLDPSPPLRELEVAILGHDPSLMWQASASVAAGPTTAPRLEPRGSLVGRGAELDVLLAALDDAAVAGTRMIVVEGEPGIGKTRLAEELAAEAEGRGAIVVWGRCYEGGAAPAFWPWLAALRSLVAAAPSAAAPGLEQLLAPAADETTDPPAANRFDLYETIGTTLARASDERTVVVVLDDVQWADEASLELLGHLAGMLDDAHVLVLITVRQLEIGRSDGVVDSLAAVARRPSSRRFRLRGLHDAAIAELLEAATGRPARAEVAAVINQRAEGNPFYAVELARLLHEDGLDAPEQIAAAAIPAGVRDVIRHRIARLPTATTELLQVAAVIGREVEAHVLLRAAGQESAESLDALEPALVHRLLVDVAERPGTYRFTHALVREVLVEDLSSLRRARLHLRVADALESPGGVQDDEAEIIAEHLFAAAPLGVAARAAAALERAAGVAIRRSAYAAAEDLLAGAVRLRRTAGSSPDQLGAELDTLASLFFVQRVVHGHQAAVEGPTMHRARELAERTGRTDVLALLLWAEWVGVDKACEFERATELATELQALAATSEHPMVERLSLHAQGVSRWHAGDLRAAIEALDRAVLLSRSSPDQERAQIDVLTAPLRPNTWSLGHPVVLMVHMLVGDLADPAAEFERMMAAQRHPFATTVVWMFAGFGALAAGDLDAALTYGLRGVEADPDLAFSYWGPGSQLCVGAALVASGQVDEGLDLVDRTLPRYVETGTRIFLPLVHARVAQGLARAGRFDEAAQVLETAYTTAATYGERWVEPVTMAVDAQLRHLRGAPPSEVAELFTRARDLATEQGAHAIARHVSETAAAAASTRRP